ncbi:nuclear transport factor 2 family protein [Pseudoroseomonas sp. WGS1072]|uniref:nuclear transport factor 2 family protein n=1 Tax=Roseomonas sp. WGS1072 TaxID=3366816 RepID=UPI003BF32FA3
MGDVTDATILDLEDRRFRATVEGDLSTLEELLADDLRYVHSNGATEGKVEFLRKLAAGERQYRRYQAAERTVHREGGFSFVFGVAIAVLVRAAGQLDMRLAYTAVYRDSPSPRLMAWHSAKSG